MAFHLAAVTTCEADGKHSFLTCGSERCKNIRGISTRGDSDRYVARVAQRLNLSRKHQVVAVIVSESRESGRICRERNGGKRDSIRDEASDKFCGDMLSVCGAASIAEQENLAPVAKSRGHFLCGLSNEVRVRSKELGFYADTFGDELLNEGFRVVHR